MIIEKIGALGASKTARTLLLSLAGFSAIGNGAQSYVHKEDTTTIDELRKSLDEEKSVNKVQGEQISKITDELAETKMLLARVKNLEQKLNSKITLDQIMDAVDKVKSSTVDLGITRKEKIDRYTTREIHETASGVIIICGSDRYIATNGHPFEGVPLEHPVLVKLYNDSDFKEPKQFFTKLLTLSNGKKALSPLGENEHDFALLEIPKDVDLEDNVGVQMRDLSKEPLKVGEPVITIGSPLGERDSVNFGIVSHTDRQMNVKKNKNHYFQTSACICEGSSGGGSFDIQGRLIGISSMRPQDGGDDIGYSIRVDSAQEALTSWGIKFD